MDNFDYDNDSKASRLQTRGISESGYNLRSSTEAKNIQSKNEQYKSPQTSSDKAFTKQMPSYQQMAANTLLNTPSTDVAQAHEKSKQLELDENKKIVDLLSQLENFVSIIPDELANYFMTKAGIDINDTKIKRFIALVAQKYITDIAEGALQYSKRRNIGTSSTAKKKDKRHILTMNDLISSLSDHGIRLRKPPYYR